ncbi:MAG: amino acid permease, partial [Arsenophonus sp. ET-DL12-MAG3]
ASLILSVCSAYLSWTFIATEIAYLSSLYNSFSKIFKYQNKNNLPYLSLWLTNGAIQISLILIWLSRSNYNILLIIASEMILVTYFLVGLFLTKISFEVNSKKIFIVSIITNLYCLWLLYASGTIN